MYIITVTDKLSGTYNSALQGVELYNDEHPESKKHSCFQLACDIGIRNAYCRAYQKLADSGMDFDAIVADTEDFIVNRTALYFCLESLDVLKKNGRMFAVAASVLKN